MLAPTLPLELNRALLAGYGCNEQGPYLIVDQLDAVPWQRHALALRGRVCTLEFGTARHCTGRYDLDSGQSSTCPALAACLEPELEQCPACFSATGFNPAFYHAARVSPQQRRRNRQPHVVYLVSFGVGTLKVGITHAPRRLSRLLEQGARIGAVIASFEDADRARELEETIARSFDVAEAVRATRKRQLLAAPFSASAARLELARVIEQIARMRPEVDRHPEILELDRHYVDAHGFDGALTDLSETDPPRISGRCLGMIGDILIMSEDSRRFILSIGNLLGRELRLRPQAAQNHFTGQLGLPF
jgi:uncharacterized protein DUF2797